MLPAKISLNQPSRRARASKLLKLLCWLLLSSLVIGGPFISSKAWAITVFEALFGKKKNPDQETENSHYNRAYDRRQNNNSQIKPKQSNNNNKKITDKKQPNGQNGANSGLYGSAGGHNANKMGALSTIASHNGALPSIAIIGDRQAMALRSGIKASYGAEFGYDLSKQTSESVALFDGKQDLVSKILPIQEKLQPSLLILAFGNNGYNEKADADKSLSHRQKIHQFYQQITDELNELLTSLEQRGQNWLLMGPAPRMLGEQASNKTQEPTREKLNIERLNSDLKELDRIFHMLSRKYHKNYIAIWDQFEEPAANAFPGEETPPPLRLKDGRFSKEGEIKLAELSRQAIEFALLPQSGPVLSKQMPGAKLPGNQLQDSAFAPKSLSEQQYLPRTPLYALDGVSYQLLDNHPN